MKPLKGKQLELLFVVLIISLCIHRCTYHYYRSTSVGSGSKTFKECQLADDLFIIVRDRLRRRDMCLWLASCSSNLFYFLLLTKSG